MKRTIFQWQEVPVLLIFAASLTPVIMNDTDLTDEVYVPYDHDSSAL